MLPAKEDQMKYLVTGGAGFIGSHLVEQLLEQDHDVLVLDDLSTGSYENIAHLDNDLPMRLVVDTVCNPDIVNECIKEVDAVFHLASAVGVRLVIDEPVKTIETIVGGTDVVLRACARYRKPILITSTSEVYGKGTRVPFGEDDDCIMGPTTKRRWSYACAKALDEFLALAHWYHSRLPVVVVRLFNTVGPRQTGQYGMVIPRFVRQALRGESITVYGTGCQARCFAHVHDVVDALTALMGTAEARGQVFNVGSDEEVTMLELAKLVKELAGSNSEIVFVPYSRAYGENFDDMQRRLPDLSRIQGLIGYRPVHGLKAILEDVILYERQSMGEVVDQAG
jgi:UDP-glucose 4-epimerase